METYIHLRVPSSGRILATLMVGGVPEDSREQSFEPSKFETTFLFGFESEARAAFKVTSATEVRKHVSVVAALATATLLKEKAAAAKAKAERRLEKIAGRAVNLLAALCAEHNARIVLDGAAFVALVDENGLEQRVHINRLCPWFKPKGNN